ncbi:hypothetical protein C2845_PM15G04560 [Panicum miliaceum]|uniref:Uncharacterized protein n=1 Tax=Panicum miliaceum TaxID=4540 RepID=A0A3L6Q4X3_PANMI|nr:hypothetical protein C2845_PM15G04560 [Panicum miliaceum]
MPVPLESVQEPLECAWCTPSLAVATAGPSAVPPGAHPLEGACSLCSGPRPVHSARSPAAPLLREAASTPARGTSFASTAASRHPPPPFPKNPRPAHPLRCRLSTTAAPAASPKIIGARTVVILFGVRCVLGPLLLGCPCRSGSKCHAGSPLRWSPYRVILAGARDASHLCPVFFLGGDPRTPTLVPALVQAQLELEEGELPPTRESAAASAGDDAIPPQRPGSTDVYMPPVRLSRFYHLAFVVVDQPTTAPTQVVQDALVGEGGNHHVTLAPYTIGAMLDMFQSNNAHENVVERQPFLG